MLADGGEAPREGRQCQVAETETMNAPVVAAAGRPRRKHFIRVGNDYQAQVPDTVSARGPGCPGPEKAVLVWAPCSGVPDSTLDEYTTLANDKYGFSIDQALGLLFVHGYDLAKAISDLDNYVPFPDDYSADDLAQFEIAIDLYNKNFRLIQAMLPHKTMSSLVNHYYLWKQTRMRASVIDKHARRRPEAATGDDSLKDSLAAKKPAPSGGTCTNCLATMNRLRHSSWGNLCSCCFEHVTRVNGHDQAAETEYSKHPSAKGRKATRARRERMLPIDLKPEDIATVSAAALEEQGGTVLCTMDRDIVDLRKQVQKNKQFISQLPRIARTSIDTFRPPKTNVRASARWTQYELFLAVQAIRKYGRDCSAIAAVIGNKTEAHVRELLAGDGQVFRLDDIAQEFDATYGGVSAARKDDGEVECIMLD